MRESGGTADDVVALSRILARKLRAFIGLPAFVRAWCAPAWLLLGVARVLVVAVPFTRFSASLGVPIASPWIPLPTPAQQHRARLIGLAVTTAARHTPWTSNCLPQALVAHWLLAAFGIPSAVFLGVQRIPQTRGLQAHAWVSTGRIHVTGGDGFRAHTVVATFVGSQRVRPS